MTVDIYFGKKMKSELESYQVDAVESKLHASTNLNVGGGNIFGKEMLSTITSNILLLEDLRW